MKKIITILAFLLCYSTVNYAQQAVASGGGYHENTSGSVSWTLGEVMTETFRANEVILTQGFQQPSITVTSVDEYAGLDFKIIAFPNPAREYINVKIDTDNFDNIWYELYDFKGLVIEQKRIDDEIVHISLHDMEPAVYFLRIIEGRKVLKTFKIVKQ